MLDISASCSYKKKVFFIQKEECGYYYICNIYTVVGVFNFLILGFHISPALLVLAQIVVCYCSLEILFDTSV